jgi:hypothetical protein
MKLVNFAYQARVLLSYHRWEQADNLLVVAIMREEWLTDLRAHDGLLLTTTS